VQTAFATYRLGAPQDAPLNGLFLANGFELLPFWVGSFAAGAAAGTWLACSRHRPPAWPFWLAVPPAAALLLAVPWWRPEDAAFAQGTGAFLRPLLPLLALPLFAAVALTADRYLAARPAQATTRRLVSTIGRYALGVYVLHEALMYLPGGLLRESLLQRDLPLSIAGVALLAPATVVLAMAATRLAAATPLAATLGMAREPLGPTARRWRRGVPLLAGSLLLAGCTSTAGDLRPSGSDLVVDRTVPGDVAVWNRDLTVSGHVEGNVRLSQGRLALRPGGQVDGTIYVWNHGQPVTLDGRVGGDVRASDAPVILSPSAVVRGDVIVWSGTLQRSPGAQVGGAVRDYR
jgi:cytoskeletal protein CcmA (bactofilin family)